jgi:PAS domain-containing protein
MWLSAGTSVASAAERTADDLRTITQSTTGPGLLGEGYLTHGGWGRRGFGGSIDYRQLLADALGITVEELDAACETARTAAIEEAVKQDLITQEQADQMLAREGTKRGWFGFRGFGRGPKGIANGKIDEEALLADALGITVDELRSAREKANQAAIDQAIAEGIITQEQADQMLARKNLHSYLDRNALLAKALGIPVEDLEGKTLSDLMGERDLDAAALREKLAEARKEALAQAVKDGVITLEQADQIQDGPGWGFMGPGGRGGFGGSKSHGRPRHPDADGDEDTPGMRFRRRGRPIQPDSTL